MRTFSVDTCRLIVFIALLVKVFAYIFFSGVLGLVGGGNDANYYDEYALGYVDNAVNFWPILLRIFVDIGVYNRQWISVALFVLSSLFIPFVFSQIIVRQLHLRCFSRKVFWNSFILVVIYPTVFFYSLDIYRDVLMYCFFILAVYFYSEHLLLKKKQCLFPDNCFYSFYSHMSVIYLGSILGRRFLCHFLLPPWLIWKKGFIVVYFFILLFLLFFISSIFLNPL